MTELSLSDNAVEIAERLAEAQRDLHAIAKQLFNGTGSKRAEREDFARRLNGISSSLRTAELLAEETER